MKTTDVLIKKGLIDEKQLKAARAEAKRTGLTVDKAIVRLGYITEEDIAKTMAEELGVPYMDLKGYVIDQEVLQLIPEKTAKRFKAIPLFKVGQSLTVAMVNPHDIIAIDELRANSGLSAIDPVLAVDSEIETAIERYYGVSGTVEEVIQGIPLPKEGGEGGEELGIEGLTRIAEEAPVVKLVNRLIMQAVREEASDIHIEPEGEVLRVRYRVDGILHEVTTPPKHLQNAVISRIKILSQMDIAEKRRPQDGRIIMNIENKDVDLRVSVFPTVHGENVVMRILDRSAAIRQLADLGMNPVSLKMYDGLVRRPHGIILVTGPTGSGKTTTLYAALTTVNSMEKDIVTIEDPVEYEIPLIRQTQVNPKIGLTFANGLRNIVRQDPDIIMVGEVRDKETADIAIQASLTGHLVFSTLHTNDAASSLTRLEDMGVEPFLISSTVIGILAQRLVRVICSKCKESYTPAKEVLDHLGLGETTTFYRGKGCKECGERGYRGRRGIFELLVMDEEIRRMVVAKASSDQIAKVAIEKGMITLYYDGLEKVTQGITTLEEVLRVTESV